jgi:hypothetical protein
MRDFVDDWNKCSRAERMRIGEVFDQRALLLFGAALDGMDINLPAFSFVLCLAIAS